MMISLPPDLQELVDRKVQDGTYASAADVVRAALDQFLRQHEDFVPRELDELLARGTADIEQRRTFPGKSVFDEIRAASAAAARRGESR